MPVTTAPSRRRSVQFSLLTLLLVMFVAACLLGLYKRAGTGPFVHYYLLLFAVGPWFAYLLSECFPIRSVQTRAAIANFTLLFLFIGGLKLSERVFSGPPILFAGLAALLLWTTQYMIFFVWRAR